MFLITQAALFAQSSRGGFPRLEPLPKALEYSRRGAEGYTWTDLAEISLWASGADSSRLDRIHSLARSIQSSPEFPALNRDRAEFILAYIHKNILKYYSIEQNSIDTVFFNGRYNCVSSAVLYLILCKSMGIDANGVMTRDHAFVTVVSDGESIDVETTNPYGFDPGSRREFHDQFGKLTGFAYVPARNYRERQTISPIELVSLILSNRISVLERANRFTEAVPLAADRAALLAGRTPAAARGAEPAVSFFEDPREVLLVRLLNYGASLLSAGREEDCLAWAALASPGYGDDERWQELMTAAVNNRITKYLRAGQRAEARAFLNARQALLNRANYDQLDAMLIDSELLDRVNKLSGAAEADSVIDAIAEARSKGSINASRASELLTYAIQKTAAILSAAPHRDWLAAINYIENAIARFGPNRELEQSLRTYRSNRAADFHNRFAAAWNNNNRKEAVRILDEGLAEFPSDRQLLADRETVNKAR